MWTIDHGGSNGSDLDVSSATSPPPSRCGGHRESGRAGKTRVGRASHSISVSNLVNKFKNQINKNRNIMLPPFQIICCFSFLYIPFIVHLDINIYLDE
jgi:hypothetical protein